MRVNVHHAAQIQTVGSWVMLMAIVVLNDDYGSLRTAYPRIFYLSTRASILSGVN